ncbi:hypothetical protein HDU98_003640 [Podochytrium sp. JEL0797]|nr:hypothetical protein HDU98_003640 [Podochytrium sp. JEL0797]
MVPWGRRINTKSYSPSPPRFRSPLPALHNDSTTSPDIHNPSVRLTLLSLLAICVAFTLTALATLSAFSHIVQTLGLVTIVSGSANPSDQVTSAVLTVWVTHFDSSNSKLKPHSPHHVKYQGSCKTFTNGTTSCLPATDLKTIGNNSYGFQFTPSPPPSSPKQWTVTETIDALPYTTNPILIFTLPIATIILGVALIGAVAAVVCFWLRKVWRGKWVACGKFVSVSCFAAWICLVICCACSGVAQVGMVAYLSGFQLSSLTLIEGITASLSPAILTLMITSLVSTTTAMGLSLWSWIHAKRFDASITAKDNFELMENGGGRFDDDDERYDTAPRVAPQRGSVDSWEDEYPSKGRDLRDGRDEKDARGGRDQQRGGGGRKNGPPRNNPRYSRRDTYDEMGSEKEEKSVQPVEAPKKSDWGILRTVNGVAGGVYGYLGGGKTNAAAEPVVAPVEERKRGNAIANASGKDRGGRSGGGNGIHALLVIHHLLGDLTPATDLLHLFSTCRFFVQARLFAISKSRIGICIEYTPDGRLNHGLGNIFPLVRAADFFPRSRLDRFGLSFEGLEIISSFREIRELFPKLEPFCVEDIAELGNLTGVKELELRVSYHLSNISWIHNLAALRVLRLENSAVVDINSIGELAQLKLSLHSTAGVVVFSPLAKPTHLRDLDHSHHSLNGISNFTALTFLELELTTLPSLNPLSSLINLEHLDINECGLQSIEPLSNLEKLKTLLCRYNKITDIAPLTTLCSSTTLVLEENPHVDIRPLASLKNLEILDLSDTNMYNLKPLSKLAKMKELRVNGAKVASVALLKRCVALETLL